MEDEIDLREYMTILWRRRYLIAGVAVASLLVAVVLSLFVLQPVYEASTLLLVSEPRFRPGSPSETLQGGTLQGGTLPKVSTDDLIPMVHNEVVGAQVARRIGEAALTPAELVKRVRLSPVRGAGLLRVTARDATPDGAEALARRWSDTIVEYVDALAFDETRRTLTVVEEKAAQARAELGTAEQELREFQATSRIPVLSQRIAEVVQRIAAYEARLIELEQGGAAVAGEVTLRPSGNAYALTVTSLRDPAQVRRVLAVFQVRLEESQDALATEQQRQTQLLRQVDVARSTYQLLIQKREELRILLGSNSGMIRVAVPPTRPRAPAAPRTNLNIILGGILGLTAGAILAFVLESLRPVARTVPRPAGHSAAETPIAPD